MAAARPLAATAERERLAWAALQDVPDPEVPVISVCELGIVREVHALPEGQGMEIDAIEAAGLGPARAVLRRAPAWTTDWISDDGRRKLREYGIAPPGRCGGDDAGLPAGTSPIRLVRRRPGITVPEPVACPHCGSLHTERLSAFGATACKALHRCLDCREPFEHFKPI
jgi:ring-1,2-phenylacetyl-CoA epoxidase subunit PaaD